MRFAKTLTSCVLGVVLLGTTACGGEPPDARAQAHNGHHEDPASEEEPAHEEGSGRAGHDESGDDGGNDHSRHSLPSAQDQEANPASRGAKPTRVRIPEVDVDSTLVDLGVRADGTAKVPEDPDLASWYQEGGRPGDRLPTVLLGHVDSTDGPAVFARIHELNDGDRIEVSDEDGSLYTYEVVDVQVHPYDAFPTFEVFGNAGEGVLRLVTCTGVFDPAGGYEENLIVYADLV